MGKNNKVSINDFKSFVQEYNNNDNAFENKSGFAIKLQLKKQLKFVEKALLAIPTTKQGKECLLQYLDDERKNAIKYIPKHNAIRQLDMTICHYASLGMVLVALSETKNHEIAEMELQDVKNNPSLQLNDALRFAHYKRSAEMILKRDGFVLENIADPRGKSGFFVVHGMPAPDTPVNEPPVSEPNGSTSNTPEQNLNYGNDENNQGTDVTPSSFDDFDM